MSIRAIGNLLLIGCSIALTFLVVEGLMRLSMNPTDLIGSYPTIPALNQWKNELRYWERYHDRPDQLHRHDPLLGWDASYGTSRARDRAEIVLPTELRAVAVGDSFVYGNEVAADENFSALLDKRDNGLAVLNMGVPGYGIDQSYLKYRHYGAPNDPDIVIFGIYVSDYERSTVRFSALAKPLYVLDGQTIRLTNQPVQEPRAELTRIDAALKERWYLPEFLRNFRLALARDQHTAEFYRVGDRIVSHLLGELQATLEPDQRLLIVHFRRGESFTEPDPQYTAMHERLLGIYRQQGIDFVDLGAEFLRKTAPEKVAEAFYVVHPGGRIGHLSPAGHRLAAELIAAHFHLNP